MAFLNVNRQKQKDELNWIKLLLDSKEYKDLLNNEFFPDFSNSFLAASFIQEKLGNYNAAFHLAMKSAWIADDNGNKNAAEFSRNKALKFLDKTTDDFIDQSEKILLKIDLLRRTARFEVAKRLIDQAFIEIDSDEKIFKIISFQNELVFKKDTASHRIGERTAV
jgi:tetratricopeptide (TPR) repeat protein